MRLVDGAGASPSDTPVAEKLPQEDGGANQASDEAPITSKATEASQPDRILPQSGTSTRQSEGPGEIQPGSSPVVENGTPAHITFGPHAFYRPSTPPSRPGHHRLLSMQGVGAYPGAAIKRRPSTSLSNTPSRVQPDDLEPANDHLPFSSSGFLSRNSHFHHLSEEEREKLGGCEYRAIRLLSWLVPSYFVLFQLFGAIGLGAYSASNKASPARKNGLSPWWVGSFNAISAFNNSGMCLLDANMVAYQTSTYTLLTMGFLILAGNTCFPIFLRLIVWMSLKVASNNDAWKEFRKTLQFLLDHPRRCYTNLFPSRHTWWLLASVICTSNLLYAYRTFANRATLGLNGVDWVAFEVLNIGNDAITSLPDGYEALDGLFQALAVRNGGFYVVPIPSVRISLQVLYVIMMYISVYPVVRRSRSTL